MSTIRSKDYGTQAGSVVVTDNTNREHVRKTQGLWDSLAPTDNKPEDSRLIGLDADLQHEHELSDDLELCPCGDNFIGHCDCGEE